MMRIILAGCLVLAGLRAAAAGSEAGEDDRRADAKSGTQDGPKGPDPLKVLRIPTSSPFATGPPREGANIAALGLTAAENEALRRFREAYVLQPGEVVRRIAAPPPLGRALNRAVFALHHGGDWKAMRNEWERHERQGELSNQIYRWRYDEPVWVSGALAGGANNAGTRLANLLEMISGLPSRAIEGDETLRKTSVAGDFLIREGEPLETMLPRLGELIRRECKLPLRLTFRDVARRVIVVRGRYDPRRVPGGYDDTVTIAVGIPKALNKLFSGAGNFDDFLYRVGSELGWLVVSDDVQDVPKSFQWLSRNGTIPKTDTARVLDFLHEQTGLTFTEATRRVQILFVERTEGE